MFGRFSSVLQNAVDALAPPACPLHDFVFHWKMTMKFYINNSNPSKTTIESTNIPEHLDQLLKILLEEEESLGMETMGPCMEYLLQHRLLDLLVTLAHTDCPPGMKQHTLIFVRKLISQIQQPIVPHVSVYKPIQHLVRLCNGMGASPTESYEIAFLCSLCAVICKHPHLTNIFIFESSKRKSMNTLGAACISSGIEDKNNFPQIWNSERGSSVSYLTDKTQNMTENEADFQTSDQDEMSELPALHCAKEHEILSYFNQESEIGYELNTLSTHLEQMRLNGSSYQDNVPFKSSTVTLLDALLSFLHSADSRVTIKACEGLMVIASLPSDGFAHSVVQHSNLCMVLATRLQTLYDAIPLDLDPNDVDDMQVNWGLDSPLWSDGTLFPGCRQIAAFFAWLDYCNQLIREAHPIISSALAQAIRVLFLEQVLGSVLFDSQANLVTATAFITKCLKQTSAPALLTEFVHWLVGDHREPELPGVGTCRIRQQLLDNCFHEKDEVSLETLRLFEVLLEKPSEHTYHCLITTYLSSRAYYDNTVSEAPVDSWSDEEENEQEKQRDTSLLDFSSDSSPVSRTLAPSNIHEIINSFLFLLPQQFHSATDPEELGYEHYVQDADRQYQTWVTRCRCYSWPAEATFPDSGSSDSRPEADHGKLFYEGPFLRMILTRLLRVPYQPYEITLQLTGLISRVAMLPHPYVHEFILNPLLPILPDVATVYTTLEIVANEMVLQISKIENYKQLLLQTRHRLLGDGSNTLEESNSLFESVIVLEEFCRELAAIAFVKYHDSS